MLWLCPEGSSGPVGERVRTLTSLADDGPADTLSALSRPGEALGLVHGLVGEALSLDEQDPWTPGLAVPPTQGVATSLDAALAQGPGPHRDAALLAALGEGGALPLP